MKEGFRKRIRESAVCEAHHNERDAAKSPQEYDGIEENRGHEKAVPLGKFRKHHQNLCGERKLDIQALKKWEELWQDEHEHPKTDRNGKRKNNHRIDHRR